MLKNSVLILISLTLNSMAIAQEALQDLPGSIPLKNERPQASDLVDERGTPLFPEDLSSLADTSHLNPGGSDLWSETPLEEVPSLPLESRNEIFEWSGDITAAVTWQTFLAKRHSTSENSKEFYKILLSRKVHSVLLRAKLLQKLGYRMPPMKHLKNFRLVFPSKGQRDDFLNITMIDQLDALPSRWVKNVTKSVGDANTDKAGEVVWKVTRKTDDCVCLEIQDAVAFYSTTHLYNLPVGVVSQESMQGRRVFESLLVPFGLTYVDESFNMLSWQMGKIFNDRLFIDYEYNHQFYPNYDDAKWIARRILRLSRKDWNEIVSFANYPRAVEILAVEKMISRRNDLIDLFDLQNEFKKMKFNPQVSYVEMGQEVLKNGKLLQLEWPGYAPSFGFGDPESPLNNSEMFGFLRSKVYSNAINNFISEFNTQFLPRTNLGQKIAKKNYDILLDALVEGALNGRPAEIPFGYYTIPYFGTNLIASREIVAGQILGTENPVQLSHTFGFSIQAGQYLGVHGLPVGQSASGRAEAYFTRTYSHLKPVTNIKTALEQPYKNIVVPFLAQSIGERLNGIWSGSFENMSKLEPEKRKEIEADLTEIVSTFSSYFSVGESLIITDSIGGFIEGNLGVNVDALQIGGIDSKTKAYLEAKANQHTISRLHIFRKSENVIQIYDDKGQVLKLGLNLGVDVGGVRFVSLEFFAHVNGSAMTKFTPLQLTTEKNDKGELVDAEGLVDNLKILYRLLTGFNKESLYAKREPTILSHDFNERGLRYRLFWNEGKYHNSMNDITLQYAGDVAHFIRATRGFRSGNNWEGLGVSTSNLVLNELLEDYDINIQSQSGEDPGYTYKGKSKARRVIYEAQVKNDKLMEPFLQVEHRWRGWSANRKQLDRILEEVNNTYPIPGGGKAKLYREYELANVQELQLYSIYLTFNLYARGWSQLVQTPFKEIKKAFERTAEKLPRNHPALRNRSGDDDDYYKRAQRADWARTKAYEFKRKYDRRNRAMSEGDFAKVARANVDMLEFLEKSLLWEELLTLVGGPDNVFIQSRITGFRKGDEQINPDTGLHNPFVSNSFGVIGSRKTNGPLTFVRDRLGITESEMFLYWIMENL